MKSPLLTLRYKLTENTQILHDIKERCCLILLKIIEIREDIRLSKFFYNYKMDFIKNGAKIPTMKPLSLDKMSFLQENN